ncbi:hypothetical protein FisN_23Lh251 [Fistulifera solaris]|uniref:Uncharacterized protein n=1 Tax=Fistulifera solaris TaxID=1519565 RepID=A0A1Z5JRG2_FISSO|nr:hypothetical protein FisN_23Lh251 [Fistulifera solaris]|eukprot:GAX16620.1 hypothetical protein FisN_23Lh251 [Fistulifera solaris]
MIKYFLFPSLICCTKGYPVMQRSQAKHVFADHDPSLLERTPAVMHYVTPETQIAHIYRDISGADEGFRNVEWQGYEVWIENGRLQRPTLEKQAFALYQNVLPDNSIDFKDIKDVKERYYPLCEAFLKNITGCSVVAAFDHNVRISGSNAEKLANGKGATVQQPLGVVHGDYTAISAPRRLLGLASGSASSNDIRDEGAVLEENLVKSAVSTKTRRYAIINLWRNIDRDNPVETNPLACIDAQTVSAEDWRTLQIHYTDRVGENILPCFSGSHRWVYFPQMTHDEVLVLKQWDSAGGLAQSKPDLEKVCSTCCLHSAFLEPKGLAEKTTRQSIEVRCVCIW